LLAFFKERLSDQVGSTEGKSFLVAVSGGMDSTLLAHLCRKAKLDFSICHVNYKLRGESSDLDESFVLQLAQELGAEAHIKQADLSNYKGNIQSEARRIRYALFIQLIAERAYDHIMTAHHLDDVAETFLFNVGRGTGVEGLMSIPAINGQIIRPLLTFSKEEITAYAKAKAIPYRKDASNATDKYARNFLRHQVVPKLKEQNSHFLQGLKKSIAYLQGVDHFAKVGMSTILKNNLIEDDEDRLVYRAEMFTQNDHPQSLAYHWLHPYGFSTGQIFNYFSTSNWVNGAQLHSDLWKLTYDRSTFILAKIKKRTSRIIFDPKIIRKIRFNDFEFSFSFTEEFDFKKENKYLAYFDASRLTNLQIRQWQNGDRFQPKGMKGRSKKVKKFFSDAKFALDQKADTPFLVSGEEIMWIVGHRRDVRYLVKEGLSLYMRVTVEKVS